MDSLEKQLLLRDLDQYGYSLAGGPTPDPRQTLERMLKSDDGRILEGVPVVLTNVLLSEPEFDLEKFEKQLPTSLQRRFRMLAALTNHFLLWLPKSEKTRFELTKYLKKREPVQLERVLQTLSAERPFNLGAGVSLDAQRLQNTYKNYVVAQFLNKEESLAKTLENERQANLMEALSELFTEKQRSLLFKMLRKDKLQKTEREYYSRTIKPRLKALSNSDLQSLASTLLGF